MLPPVADPLKCLQRVVFRSRKLITGASIAAGPSFRTCCSLVLSLACQNAKVQNVHRLIWECMSYAHGGFSICESTESTDFMLEYAVCVGLCLLVVSGFTLAARLND